VFEFFATKALDQHHWTLKSWFGAFLNVWVHLGLFHYCMKLDANHAELVVQLMEKVVQ